MPPRSPAAALLPCFDAANGLEIGLDESGRGPLFGRLYVAAVALPADGSFDHARVRDSKTIKSRRKMREAAEYVMGAALAFRVHYVEAGVVDALNVLQADVGAMHACARLLLADPALAGVAPADVLLLVDGDYFRPCALFDAARGEMAVLRDQTVVGGDGKFSGIAAASILAKDARDAYIEALCASHPELAARYAIDSNKGYGSARHMAGIREHGISQFHRRSFGPCKTAALNSVEPHAGTIIASTAALATVA